MRNLLRLITLRSSFLAIVACLIVGGPSNAAAPRQADATLAHHHVSTKSGAAQHEFDVAMSLLYAFNPEEATFHFQQAARLDPTLAMAYWGIAISAGPNINTEYNLDRAAIGHAAIAEAQRLNGARHDEESAYIAALSPRYAARSAADVTRAQEAYAQAMVRLAHDNPADLDAQTLAAESLMDLTPLHMWRADGKPNRYTTQVLSLLHAVLARDPNHLGANHLLIHAYEDSSQPQAALAAARHLAALDLPPGAEHLAHMPAHIFNRVGDYDAAITASLKAIALFHSYTPHEHSDVHNGYYHHDYQVLDYAYMMSGQWAKAKAVADQLAQQVGDNGAAVETYLRFHRFHELLALAAPTQPGPRWRYAVGMSSAAVGDLASARATLAQLNDRNDHDPRTALARETLAAEISLREHRDRDAIAALRRAVAIQDGLTSKEPPEWYYPIRETLGARLAIVHDLRGAEQTFREDLKRNPNNPRSLFGLATVLQRSDPAGATRTWASFHAAWHHADTTLQLDEL